MSGDSAPKKGSVQKWENGFQLERLAMGKPDGKLAKPGKKVVVRYKGSLQNGKVFDETKGNKTFSFRLGEAPDTLTPPSDPFLSKARGGGGVPVCLSNRSPVNERQLI